MEAGSLVYALAAGWWRNLRHGQCTRDPVAMYNERAERSGVEQGTNTSAAASGTGQSQTAKKVPLPGGPIDLSRNSLPSQDDGSWRHCVWRQWQFRHSRCNGALGQVTLWTWTHSLPGTCIGFATIG